MPTAFMIVGAFMVTTAVFGRPKTLESYLATDLAPGSNLFAWVGALSGIAALGFIKPLEGVSRSFLVLTILAVSVREGNQILGLLQNGPQIPGAEKVGENAQPERLQNVEDILNRLMDGLDMLREGI